MFTAKKNNKGQKRKLWTAVFCLAAALLLWQGNTLSIYAQGTAKVVAGSGKIREKASTDSTTIASVKKGDKLDVTASTKDSQGYTWYKVLDGDNKGYIRADLVDVEGTIPEEKNSAETTGTTTVGSGNSSQSEVDAVVAGEESEAAPEPSNVALAKVKEDVRVRKFAGTAFDVAASAKANTEVTVSGEKLGEDGKLWYKVSYNEGDKTINGYIREDFLEVLEYVPEDSQTEEEAPVEEAPPVEENNDYYLKYMENGEGEMDWYLFDNIEGTSQSLTQTLKALDQIRENGLQENGQLKLFKILLIVAILFIIGLVVAVTILVFKLRDAYYGEDYEDDEEEDEEEEEEILVEKPIFRGRKAQAAPAEPKKAAAVERSAAPARPSAQKAAEAPKPEKKESWQSKDFLEVDDDMEFEFLDL